MKWLNPATEPETSQNSTSSGRPGRGRRYAGRIGTPPVDIERRSVPQDARLKQLLLTEEGIRFHEKTILSFHQTDDYVASLLTEEENRELLRLLNKLREALK